MNQSISRKIGLSIFSICAGIVIVNCGGENGDGSPATTVGIVKTNGDIVPDVTQGNTPIPLGSKVMITFAEVIPASDQQAVQDAITLLAPNDVAIAGTFSWNAEGTEIIFSPSRRLKPATTYALSVMESIAQPSLVLKALPASTTSFTTMTRGDINGDGFADLLVGAWGKEVGGFGSTGAAYVFMGSAEGIFPTFTWKQEGEQDAEHFGQQWELADVNGDGYEDGLIAAPRKDAGIGEVLVYHGGPEGLATTPHLVLAAQPDDRDFGYSIGNAGDINGDGFDDVLIGAPDHEEGGKQNAGIAHLYYGSTAGLPATPDFSTPSGGEDESIGASVAGAGDVNGDGFDDLLFSSPGFDNGRGAVFLLYGSETGPDLFTYEEFEGENPGDAFGALVTGLGDVNGDGYADIAISAAASDAGRGAVYVGYGSENGIDTATSTKLTGALADSSFAFIDELGDVNDDGFDDLLVGAALQDNENGAAYLYLGSAGGISQTAAKDWISDTQQAFGVVLMGRDVNGDGFSDIVIDAPRYDTQRGRVFIYFGTEALPDDTPDVLAGEDEEDLFGLNFPS